MSRLHEVAIEALNQVASLINSVESSSGTTENLYATSGVGVHVRHVADHFRAFQAGITSGIVDYNVRRRECELERQSDLGLLEIQNLITWLQTAALGEASVTVVSEISCLQTETERFQSNTNRELLYLANHTIHPAAYAALLARQYGVAPAVGVGHAPATASYLRDSGAKVDELYSSEWTYSPQSCRIEPPLDQ